MEENKRLPQVGDTKTIPIVAGDVFLMMLASAMATGIFGISLLFDLSPENAILFPSVVAFFWVRKSSKDQDVPTLFLIMAALCFGIGRPSGYVFGCLYGMFALLGLAHLWGLTRTKKLWNTVHFMIFLAFLLTTGASVFFATALLPAWTFVGLAVGYLFLATILFLLPIALAMQASFKGDR